MVKAKSKYKILLPRYKAILKETRDRERREEEAYTSDLDIDLTNESSFEMQELKINFAVLVPQDHKFIK